MSEHHYLPALLAEIADVAGLPAALAIAQEKGGVRVHFPARAPDGHWLVRCVGREAADKICGHFRATMQGGIYLQIPLGPKNFYRNAYALAMQMIASGEASNEQIAAALGIHRRTVERHRARARDLGADGPQGRLF